MKMGAKCGFWVGGFFTAEEAVDRLRGEEDFLSTVVAGLGVAGVFTLWSKFGLGIGVGFGWINKMLITGGVFRSFSIARGYSDGEIGFVVWSCFWSVGRSVGFGEGP